MGQSQVSRRGGAVDTVITNAVVLDHSGIIKADIALKDGRIVALAWLSFRVAGRGRRGEVDLREVALVESDE